MSQPNAYAGGSIALINGRVFTADPNNPSASAVGIWRGTIAYVGDDPDAARAAAGADAEVIDLAGRTASPGLIDAHTHPCFYAENLKNIFLGDATSVADVLQRAQERAARTPVGEPIIGQAYYALTLAEGRMPTLAELDAAVPDHPVIFIHRSGHDMVVNSRTLAAAGITRDTPDPLGGTFERDADGNLTGVLTENAMEPVRALRGDAGEEQYRELLQLATDSFLSFGITSVGEANMTSPDLLRAYQAVQGDSSRPRVRYNLMLGHWEMLDPGLGLGAGTGLGNPWLRFGAMKFFIDGTEGQRTAKVSVGFEDDGDNLGMWMFPPEQFRERVLRAHHGGWQVAVHAIGDAAVELTLDTFREAQEQKPQPHLRHRIEHASLLRADLVDRFAAEGVIPIPGGRFASNDYPILLARFGKERLRWYQPWSAFIERNVPVAISSDAPVQSPDPAKNLWALVNSRSEHNREVEMQPEERISLEEALIAYTRNGAYASNEEHVKGMLRVGYYGDVTVFNTDLSSVPALELDQVQADVTIVDGSVAFRRA